MKLQGCEPLFKLVFFLLKALLLKFNITLDSCYQDENGEMGRRRKYNSDNLQEELSWYFNDCTRVWKASSIYSRHQSHDMSAIFWLTGDLQCSCITQTSFFFIPSFAVLADVSCSFDSDSKPMCGWTNKHFALSAPTWKVEEYGPDSQEKRSSGRLLSHRPTLALCIILLSLLVFWRLKKNYLSVF